LFRDYAKKFEFVERERVQPDEEAGLKEFLRYQPVSGDATEEEIEFFKEAEVQRKAPTPLYYYRELQNLRDPLHFRAPMTQTVQKKTLGQFQPKGSVAPMHKFMEADCMEKQLQLNGRKRAIQRWAGIKGSRGKKQKTSRRKFRWPEQRGAYESSPERAIYQAFPIRLSSVGSIR